MKKWRLKSKEERRFKQGHPWVYSNELQESPKGIEPGEVVELQDASGAFLAYGFGNPGSLIAFRALSRARVEGEFLSEDFFAQVIGKALAFRLQWFSKRNSFRAVYGEVDGLPGLVIDRFAKQNQVVYVVQPHSAGMDRHLQLILEGLKNVSCSIQDPANTSVILRRDAGSREREGLTKIPTEARAMATGEVIVDVDDAFSAFRKFAFIVPGLNETDVTLWTDLIAGQKTGFFFDQQQNVKTLEAFLRRKLRHLKSLPQKSSPQKSSDMPGKQRILDLCSYIGQWSVHLAQTCIAAEVLPVEVTCVDASESALQFAKANLQGLATAEGKEAQIRIQTVKADVLEPLTMLPSKSYEVVIADPPAFIKNRKSIPQGKHAYSSLFATAIDRTAPGGLVVCCSCSQLLSNEDMVECLAKASRRSQRKVRWIAQGSPSLDHFSAFEFSEGTYLKCWIGVVE